MWTSGYFRWKTKLIHITNLALWNTRVNSHTIKNIVAMKQMANSVHVKHSLTLPCILYRTDQTLLNSIKSRIKEDVQNVAQAQQYSFRNAYGRVLHSTQ